jgi:hypothetical protein
MPLIIICKECNEVLYQGDLLKSPQDVIKKFERRCPGCNVELPVKLDADAISVKPNKTPNHTP